MDTIKYGKLYVCVAIKLYRKIQRTKVSFNLTAGIGREIFHMNIKYPCETFYTHYTTYMCESM